MAMCCFACTDDSDKPVGWDSRPWSSARSYIQDVDGNTLYTYCAKPYYDDGVATLSIRETYILKVAYCPMGHDAPSEEWHDTWFEGLDENCLQITRRCDIEEVEEMGRYFELKPIGEPTQTSFKICYGVNGEKLSLFGGRVEVKINIVE